MQSQLGSAPGPLSTAQSQLPPLLGSSAHSICLSHGILYQSFCSNWGTLSICHLCKPLIQWLLYKFLRRFQGEKSCSLQNYSPCWGKTVADCQEVITWAKKVGSSWAPRAWRVSQTKSKYVGCDSDLLFSCGHMLWQSAGRFFWATCALVGQHVQSLETIPRGTCILMVNIQIVNMPTYQLIYRQNMGKRR